MTDLKSSIAKGLIAALCSVLAMAAGAASARQEARAQDAQDPPQHRDVSRTL